jgi:hypothetical protein
MLENGMMFNPARAEQWHGPSSHLFSRTMTSGPRAIVSTFAAVATHS